MEVMKQREMEESWGQNVLFQGHIPSDQTPYLPVMPSAGTTFVTQGPQRTFRIQTNIVVIYAF